MVLNRKSRGFKPEVTWFGMGNRGPVGKRDRGLRVGKHRGPVLKKGWRARATPQRKRRLKVQSPIGATGVVL